MSSGVIRRVDSSSSLPNADTIALLSSVLDGSFDAAFLVDAKGGVEQRAVDVARCEPGDVELQEGCDLKRVFPCIGPTADDKWFTAE